MNNGTTTIPSHVDATIGVAKVGDGIPKTKAFRITDRGLALGAALHGARSPAEAVADLTRRRNQPVGEEEERAIGEAWASLVSEGMIAADGMVLWGSA